MTVHLRDDKFIISCAARTGSTMLQLLLDSHPDVICHGEPIDPGGLGLLTGRYLDLRYRHPELDHELAERMRARPGAFLYDVLFDAQGHRAVGFKFKTDEALSGEAPFKTYQWLIVADRDIKVIRLTRRNLLAQLISREFVRRTGVTLVRDGEQTPPLEPFRIEPADALGFVRDVVERERLADAAYGGHRQVRVTYEDLIEAPEATQTRLLDFLGVPRQALEVSTRKMLADPASLISNLEEVATALARAGFSAAAPAT